VAPPGLLSSAGVAAGAGEAEDVAPAGAGLGGITSEVFVPQAPSRISARMDAKVRMLAAKIAMLAEGM
jgi:hypothetical protein